MAPYRTQRPDDIDLKSLWQAAIRSLPKLIFLGLALGAVTYGALALVAPRYVSETQLAIESKGSNNPFTDPSRSGSDGLAFRMDKEAVNTHVRALMSADLAETVIRDMQLVDRREFNGARGAPDAMSALLRTIGIGRPNMRESDQDRALNAYFDRLDVYSPKESRFIGVRFSSMDPELAAAVANRIAETYRESLARQSLNETDEVQKALEPKIAKLAEEAAGAEAAVERFRGEANIFKGGQQATGLNEQQLAELNAELSKVKATKSEAEARAKQAREMQGMGSAETLADVQKSPLIQNLVQSRVRVERQISELSATLLPGHPRMRQLDSELRGLKTQIAAEVSKVVDGMQKEAKVAGLREEAIQKSVAEIKARIVNSGPEEAKLRSLEADARSKRAELDRLRAQYEANRVRVDDSRAIPVEAQVVSSARPSTAPVFPRKSASALLVAVATVLIGLALVVTRGILAGTSLPSPRRINRAPRRHERAQPVLPEPPPRRAQPPAQKHAVPDVAAATRAAASPNRRAEPAVAPTPPVPEPAVAPAGAPASAATSAEDMAERLEIVRKSRLSGVRTIIAGSADVFSLAGAATAVCRALSDRGLTVMMIDWAPNGAGVAEPLGHPAWPGFSELLDGRARFEDVVHALADCDVQLIPSGHPMADTADGLDSDSINFALDALDDVYDHIVVVTRTEPGRALFEAIEGRFDCGVMLVDGGRGNGADAGSFLGFDVDGIALFTLQTTETAKRPQQGLRRFSRAS